MATYRWRILEHFVGKTWFSVCSGGNNTPTKWCVKITISIRQNKTVNEQATHKKCKMEICDMYMFEIVVSERTHCCTLIEIFCVNK